MFRSHVLLHGLSLDCLWVDRDRPHLPLGPSLELRRARMVRRRQRAGPCCRLCAPVCVRSPAHHAACTPFHALLRQARQGSLDPVRLLAHPHSLLAAHHALPAAQPLGTHIWSAQPPQATPRWATPCALAAHAVGAAACPTHASARNQPLFAAAAPLSPRAAGPIQLSACPYLFPVQPLLPFFSRPFMFSTLSALILRVCPPPRPPMKAGPLHTARRRVGAG